MNTPYELSEEFARYFEIISADTPELRSQAYRLRYQVYCLENRIPDFDPANYPTGEERDAYDDHAFHALLFHLPSQTLAGTVRLVVHDPADPMWVFPIEQYAGPLTHAHQPPLRPEAVAEISRFILSARFRCRRGESAFPDGLAEAKPEFSDDPGDRRHGPHPVLGLVKAMIDMSWRNGISFWCAGMEPRLQRRLERFGLGLTLAAEGIPYHGKVNAYLSSCREVMRQCRAQRPEVWSFLTDDGKIWPLAPVSSLHPGPQSSPGTSQSNGTDEITPPPLTVVRN